MQSKKKWVILLAAILVTVGLATGLIFWFQVQNPGKAPAFLPGVYTCIAQNEFCRIDDTLVIRRNRMDEDNYAVKRNTAFVRIRSGKKDAPEFQQQQWQALYVPNKCQLVSTNEADTVRYYPEKNRVSKANFYYEKIE